MSISVDVINSRSIEGRGAADNSVNFIAFLKQKFSKVRSILTGNTGNQGLLRWGFFRKRRHSANSIYVIILHWCLLQSGWLLVVNRSRFSWKKKEGTAVQDISPARGNRLDSGFHSVIDSDSGFRFTYFHLYPS